MRCRGFVTGSAVVMAILAATVPTSGAEEKAPTTSGEVRLPSGLTARFDYHYDRNALHDSRLVGGHLIALCESGALLQIDPKTGKLTREWVDARRVACLGNDGADSVLAGFEDGRVCRVDPATLAMTEIARLPDRPKWLTFRPVGGLLAVMGRAKVIDGRKWPDVTTLIHDASSGKSLELDHRTSAFLLDRAGRLWLGADKGEWGGRCSYYDSKDGTLHEVHAAKRPPPVEKFENWDGVYGFVELKDGQVWAFGGTMHMGFTTGFIRRVDGAKPVDLASFNNHERFRASMKGQPLPDRSGPTLPVTHIVEDEGGLVVFCYSEVYRTDAKFSRWSKPQQLKIGYRWGRPDSVGAYPAVRTVHRLPGKQARLLCATLQDGFILLWDGKQTNWTLPGQLKEGEINRVVATNEGLLAWGDRDDAQDQEPVWRFADGRWESWALEPPFALHPDTPKPEEPDVEETSWLHHQLLVAPGGAITTVSASAKTPGTRTTARWVGGKPRILGSEISDVDPEDCFATPDGELWNTTGADVRRFADGKWTLTSSRFEAGPNLRAIRRREPPWFLLDGDNGLLLEFTYEAGGKAPRFSEITVSDGVKAPRVLDAIPWSETDLLLATDLGLRRYEIATRKVSPSPIPEPARAVQRLCRDGSNRVWMSGDKLWMVDPAERTLHAFDALWMITRTTVTAIAADPSHADGIAAALGDGGVVFVRVEPHAPGKP